MYNNIIMSNLRFVHITIKPKIGIAQEIKKKNMIISYVISKMRILAER